MMRVEAMCDRSRLASRWSLAFCLFAWVLLFVSCKREEASQVPTTQHAGAAQSESAPEVVAMNNRGVGLMGKFEYENARQAFEQAVAIDPNNAELVVNVAIATLNRQREGDEDRAQALLDEALRIDPDCMRAVYCQGLLRLYLQSPELAQPCFERVLTADFEDAYAAYFLGQCFAQQRKYAEALVEYERALQQDDKLRSAYYAASQAYRAVGADDAAAKMLADFQALERNPQARLAEFKYTRMGRKGEAQTIDAGDAIHIPATRPDGPIFLDPEPLLTNSDQFRWKADSTDRPVSITAVDVEHDGDVDIFIANCLDGGGGIHNAVCINGGGGKFTLDPEHVLAQIPDVNAALWGDVDNDGLTDVYLCRTGPNMLWRQKERSTWSDVTAAAGTDNGSSDSVDGALFDADHDGDLDVFIVNADGPNELFNNNGDGTFKPIAAEAGIAGSGQGSRQVLPVDLDADRDVDLVVINNEPPHDVWINDRAWQYRLATGFDRFRASNVTAAIAGDSDADGSVEIMTSNASASLECWRHLDGGWESQMLAVTGGVPVGGLPPDQIALIDARGDGRPKIIRYWSGYWQRLAPGQEEQSFEWEPPDDPPRRLKSWAAVVDETRGPSMVGFGESGPLIWRPGPGRFPFANVSFTGRQVTSDNKQVRSNASGIGTRFAARIGSNWVAGDTLRGSSGPGQSLQPVAIGLGGHDQIDFLSIDWSDGVFQTEIELKAGEHHKIAETQRQLSSCPVLFAWDGERYRFITDLLGVGGMGYFVAPGECAPSRPWENLLLPDGALQPRDDQYVLKLAEPMEEACYLDSARLIAYDLPPGWEMTVDERMNIAGPEPTGEVMFYRSESLRGAVRATNDRGEDVTDSLREVDLVAAPVGEMDTRFIGMLQDEHAVTLSFDAPASPSQSVSGGTRLAMLVDGWVEYPYSQTMFAAWQANAAYRAPTLEVRGDNGEWRVVYEQFGYPAGMPRQMAVLLPDNFNPSNAMEMRIRTNQEVYFDRIALVEVEKCPQAIWRGLTLNAATLADVGFPRRTTGPQRQPSYDYDQRAPLWDTRHQRGWYTAFGGVSDLVTKPDDALAIFGPGEEIELCFDAASLPPLATGWKRRFVLEARGWCKDMDLYTKDGETLAPLPMSDPARDPATRDGLHRRFNTRHESGR